MKAAELRLIARMNQDGGAAGGEADNEQHGLLGLFQDTTRASSFGGNNQLAHTAQLTNLSTMISNDIWQILSQSTDDALLEKVKKSAENHDAMDDLIKELVDLSAYPIDFLPSDDDDMIEKMLRSQQSKRSRAKSKTMTPENYKTMLVGAIAENLLRIASGKAKNAGGGSTAGDGGFTEEQIQEFLKDSEKLAKAIRNVQSKKSIMKSKAGFSEADPRWLQLNADEALLKDLRDKGTAVSTQEAVKAVEVTNQLKEQLGEIDMDNLSPEEAKALLDSVAQMLASK